MQSTVKARQQAHGPNTERHFRASRGDVTAQPTRPIRSISAQHPFTQGAA